MTTGKRDLEWNFGEFAEHFKFEPTFLLALLDTAKVLVLALKGSFVVGDLDEDEVVDLDDGVAYSWLERFRTILTGIFRTRPLAYLPVELGVVRHP